MTYSTSLYFPTEISRNSRVLSSQAADDLSCLFFLLIPEMMSSIPGCPEAQRWVFFTPQTPTNHGEWHFPKFIGYPSKMTKIFSSNIHNVSQVGSKHFFAHLLLLLPNSPCIKDTKQHGRCFNGCPWTKNQSRCGEMQREWFGGRSNMLENIELHQLLRKTWWESVFPGCQQVLLKMWWTELRNRKKN